MTASDIAGKLLELFGPDGEHWTRGLSGYPEKRCILYGCDKLKLDASPLLEFLPDPHDHISTFNDSSDWPTVKSWLEGIQGK